MLTVRKNATIAGTAGLALTLLVTGFSSAQLQAQSKEESGAVLGAVLGAIVGSQVGGNNRAVGAIVGGVAGAMIGAGIGAALDEEDRRALSRTTRDALRSGKTRRFTSTRSGARMKVVVVNSATEAGQLCRTVRQEVVMPDGQRLEEDMRACRGADGNWKV